MFKLRLLLALLLVIYCQQGLQAQTKAPPQYETNGTLLSTVELPYKQAEKLRKKGKIIAARPYYKQSLEASYAAQDWETVLLASSYLAESYIGSRNYQEGIDLVIKAIQQLRQFPLTSPEIGYQLYNCLARLYQYGYEPRKSLRICVESLRYLRQTSTADTSLLYAKMYLQLGSSYASNSQWGQALQFYRKAEAMLPLLSQAETNQLRPNVYARLGSYYAYMWDLIPATQYLEEALDAAMHHRVTNSPEIFSLYQDIATVYQRLNEHEKAIGHYEKAAYLIQTTGLESDQVMYMQLPNIYIGIARSYRSINQPKSALFYAQKTKTLLTEAKDEVAPLLQISTQLELARIYTKMRQYEKATDLLKYTKARQAEQQTLLGFHPIMNQLSQEIEFAAAVLAKEQQDFNRAKSLFKNLHAKLSLESRKKQVDQQELNTTTLIHLAEIHRELRDLDSAFYYNQLALVCACHEFNEVAPELVPAAEQCANAPNIFRILHQKANIYQEAATYASSKEDEVAILEEGLRTIALLDELSTQSLKKAHLLRDGQTKTLISQREAPFQRGVEIALQHHAITHEVSSLEQSFYYAEKLKAQALSLSWLKNEAMSFGRVKQSVIKKEYDLLGDIVRFEKLIEEAHSRHDTFEAVRLEYDLLFCKKKEYAAFQRDLEEQYPEYHESKYAFIPERTSNLQQILQPKELLINYVFVDSQLLIYTLSQDSALTLTQSPLPPALNEQLGEIHQMLKNSSMNRRKSRTDFIELANDLYQQLLAPIEHHLQGKSKLVIIGDGMTNFLPFEVLLPSADIRAFHQLDFLVKSYDISYHYSATLLAKARRKHIDQKKGIFAFAPVYNQQNNAASSEVAEGTIESLGNSRIGQFPGILAPLPESQHEVINIIKMFAAQGQGRSALALRNSANESILKRHLRDDYKFVHIAGHSFANLLNPNLSGIACYEDHFDNEDGILHSGEIYHLDINADLVTLSSCESGYGKLEKNEGILGLNHAFISAGTPNVVFSLWKVYDKVSAKLMVDFYQEVLEDKNYTASLRQAKLNLLKDPSTAAPHYWRHYLLIGR